MYSVKVYKFQANVSNGTELDEKKNFLVYPLRVVCYALEEIWIFNLSMSRQSNYRRNGYLINLYEIFDFVYFSPLLIIKSSCHPVAYIALFLFNTTDIIQKRICIAMDSVDFILSYNYWYFLDQTKGILSHSWNWLTFKYNEMMDLCWTKQKYKK